MAGVQFCRVFVIVDGSIHNQGIFHPTFSLLPLLALLLRHLLPLHSQHLLHDPILPCLVISLRLAG